ncbi:MAG TPA: asparaginase [Pyrinomonadaceae bacterium]|jgi:L-asparaginase II|nr:asparaginase [Pyrinomonadaceae bacterium]
MSQIPIAEPLVEVKRGSITESRHRGHIVAVEPDGNIIASLGAPHNVTYLRSSAKPFQALPLLLTGAADRFGFTDREVALACASHNGEPIHTEIAASMLRKIGLGPEALKCGVHEPYSAEAARELRERGEEPNVLHNNCSGKHIGMLAVALHLGASIENYDSPENPVQKAIADVLAEFSDVAVTDMAVGIDGCGAPIFGITMRAMALTYARLVSPPASFDEATRDACARVVRVMTAYPELIGGTSERLDTEVMRAARGRVVSKVGADGVYTAGILPCEEWPNGLGFALKIEDGDDRRARPTVVVESLRQLGVLRDESLEAVSRYAFFPVKNRRGDLVGEIRASFAFYGQ